MHRLSLLALILIVGLSGCGLADLRTASLKDGGYTAAEEEKGRQLLARAWRAQGLDRLAQYQVYTVEAEDHWKGLMGRMGNLWSDGRTDLKMQFAINTFDSRVEFLSGKRKGDWAGLQSWEYYEKPVGEELQFKDKHDKRIAFGLAAYQYFFELIDRLRRAPIVVYAGSREMKGKTYELVFATWNKIEPHKGYDQYMLWLDPQTGLMEYVENTVRANYLPGGQSLYGSTHMGQFKEVDGILMPHVLSVYLKAPNKDPDSYVHRLTVRRIEFDDFDRAELYPNPDLDPLGDVKL